MKRFPHYRQYDEMDCGPVCLRTITRYYGRRFSQEYVRSLCQTTGSGSSLWGISEAAEKLGFRTLGGTISFDGLLRGGFLPCIAFWHHCHFIVVFRIRRNTVYVSDPARGLLAYPKAEFMRGWALDGDRGVILHMMPFVKRLRIT